MREGVAGATAAQAACTGRARLKAVGARARAERTWNMLLMVVTLDVSKLSGWLNADANCRVERAGMRCGKRCGAGGGRALGGGDASGMCTGRAPTQGLGARARAERTENMPPMVVTLDVSKLSGWLNADATCRRKAGMRRVKRCTAREA